MIMLAVVVVHMRHRRRYTLLTGTRHTECPDMTLVPSV